LRFSRARIGDGGDDREKGDVKQKRIVFTRTMLPL
jgi:hypothetical protein